MMNLELCHEIKRTKKSEFFLLFFFFFTITVLRDFPNVKRYLLTRIIRIKIKAYDILWLKKLFIWQFVTWILSLP